MSLRDQKKRWICTECGFIGKIGEFDIVPDPKVISNSWTVCPKCRTPDHVTDVCDEPGCDREATCGFNTRDPARGPDIYRRTCWEHSVFKEEADARKRATA